MLIFLCVSTLFGILFVLFAFTFCGNRRNSAKEEAEDADESLNEKIRCRFEEMAETFEELNRQLDLELEPLTVDAVMEDFSFNEWVAPLLLALELLHSRRFGQLRAAEPLPRDNCGKAQAALDDLTKRREYLVNIEKVPLKTKRAALETLSKCLALLSLLLLALSPLPRVLSGKEQGEAVPDFPNDDLESYVEYLNKTTWWVTFSTTPPLLKFFYAVIGSIFGFFYFDINCSQCLHLVCIPRSYDKQRLFLKKEAGDLLPQKGWFGKGCDKCKAWFGEVFSKLSGKMFGEHPRRPVVFILDSVHTDIVRYATWKLRWNPPHPAPAATELVLDVGPVEKESDDDDAVDEFSPLHPVDDNLDFV